MSLRLAWRWLVRETRAWGARLVFFIACLAVGVAAVVAVASLAAGIEEAVRGQARELLAADLVVRGRRPTPPEIREALEAVPGIQLAEVKEMASMAAAIGKDGAAGTSLLVQLIELLVEGDALGLHIVVRSVIGDAFVDRIFFALVEPIIVVESFADER